MTSLLKKISFLIIPFLLPGNAVFSQQSVSTLQIKVVDQNNALIPAVFIRLKDNEKVITEIASENPQEFISAKVPTGKYSLEVESPGFEPKALSIDVKAGKNEVTVVLEIAETVENVKVDRDPQEKATENAFSNFLTKEQIAALPDDPGEMKKVLKQMAGGGDVIIRVDGFSGADLPAKSQIASIRIVRSSYDAENHELGSVYVDVVTKVGSRRFSGSLSFIFNDEALNARNAFALRRFPEQSKNTLFNLSGPVIENKTDFSLVAGDFRNSEAQNINAFLPGGIFNYIVGSQSAGDFLNLRISHNLTKNLPVKLFYGFSNNESDNLGVGGFDLADRAYKQKDQSHELRFSTTGNFAKRFLDEFRLQYKNETSGTIPENNAAAIIVLDSFNSGGAGNYQKNSRQSFLIADNLLFGISKHALKIGGTALIEKDEQISGFNENGTFIFSTLQDFILKTPAIFSQSPGVRQAAARQYQLGAFVQDDYSFRKNFIASFGLRYEAQNNLRDKNNFSPRLAFTWTPSADGKTTLRGGIGLFYNWLDTRNLLRIRTQDQNQPGGIIIFNPAFPNPLSSGDIFDRQKSYKLLDASAANPYIFHTSLGIQRRVFKTAAFRAEYVYQKGIHQFRSRDINAPIDGARPNTAFGNIDQVESSAFFVRNAVNAGIDGNLTGKISYTIEYSLSKIISDSDGIFALPSDNYNLRYDIAAADLDQRHRLNAVLSWQLKKGLRLNALYSANSPFPYTVATGFDNNRDSNFNDRPANVKRNSLRGDWNNRLDLNLSYIFSFANRKGGKSSKGFSIVTNSAESGFDFTDPEKKFSIRIFANAENILNQTNLKDFSGVETSPFFQKATSAEQSRKITVGMRFNF